jgi:hypothetical protein
MPIELQAHANLRACIIAQNNCTRPAKRMVGRSQDWQAEPQTIAALKPNSGEPAVCCSDERAGQNEEQFLLASGAGVTVAAGLCGAENQNEGTKKEK